MLTLQRMTVAMVLATALPTAQATFDHSHAVWDQLLDEHVVWVNDHETRVDYRGFQTDDTTLQAYLDSLSAVSQAEFDTWSNDHQLAFLINAYNAFTVELILSGYPDIDSIKDLGGLLSSPWKQTFFTLFGEERHLDWIEHDIIRPLYQEPRIHVAVNCAAIGCPPLTEQAYTAEGLDQQLETNMVRFMADNSRNRYNPESGELEVSKIFDWFEEDFEQGWNGWSSLADTFSDYAKQLTDNPTLQKRIRAGEVAIDFLPYDWSLNDYDPTEHGERLSRQE